MKRYVNCIYYGESPGDDYVSGVLLLSYVIFYLLVPYSIRYTSDITSYRSPRIWRYHRSLIDWFWIFVLKISIYYVLRHLRLFCYVQLISHSLPFFLVVTCFTVYLCFCIFSLNNFTAIYWFPCLMAVPPVVDWSTPYVLTSIIYRRSEPLAESPIN